MLYIMRHGRTDWNDLRKLQGRTDIPLNDAGREMAEAARKEYADVHFDICFCSPLIRARETAEIVLRDRNIPIVPDDRLKEMSFGECEGLENSFGISDCKVRKSIPTCRKAPKAWRNCLPAPGNSCGKRRIPSWRREKTC